MKVGSFNKHFMTQIIIFVIDAPYGYFSLIPNMISGYGWHPGVKLMKFLGEVISMKTGDPDITFAEV